jgi:DNA-binding IclR family transcriptional regulator
MDSDDDRRQGIQSIEVGAALLNVLTDSRRPLMLKELAAMAQMSAAKAHRYLVSYARIGLIEQDPQTGLYDLGAFALQMGLTRLTRTDSLRLARPHVDALVMALDHTVAVGVWANHGATIVHWQESSRPIATTLRAGAVLPLLNSSTGRCCVAYLKRPVVQAILSAELEIAAASDDARLPKSIAAVESSVEDIRARGASRAVGELITGVHSFSVPVFDGLGNLSLVLTVLGDSGRFDSTWPSPILKRLREHAAALSAQLGGGKNEHSRDD